MRPAFLLLWTLAAASPADASFRIRAREHFEWSSIRFDGAPSADCFTLASTINAWWEEPFERAFGLNLTFGSPKAQDAVPAGTAEKTRLLRAGIEYKRFFHKGLFGRAGFSAAWLDTKGARGTLPGVGPYLGLGWEFPVWKLGLAPELAYQRLWLDGASYAAFTPSLGVHFYVFKGDPDMGKEER